MSLSVFIVCVCVCVRACVRACVRVRVYACACGICRYVCDIVSFTCPGKQSSGDCVPCMPGHYCLTTGQHNVTAQCMEGYYCVQGAQDPNPRGR